MAQELLDVQFGYCSPEGVITYVGKSLSSSPIVVTVETGAVDTLNNMSPLGEDSGDINKTEAGFIDDGSFSGFALFNTYSWSATQDGNTITGSFTTNPSDRDDFCIWNKTCEQSGHDIHMWNVVRDYQTSEDALPCAGFIHIDDHGYWPMSFPNGSNHAYTVTITGVGNKTKVFDFALSLFNDAGLYDGDPYATYGQDEDRLWGRRHLNLLPQWGDWDAGTDEMGWSVPVTDIRFVSSKVVWDAAMKPLQPPPIAGAIANGDNSWHGVIGCVEIFALDGISKATGDGSSPASLAPPTEIYGSVQRTNFLNEIDTITQPFTCMPMNYSIKYMDVKVGTNRSITELANNPLKNWRLDEFSALFTKESSTPKSLMANPKTNGLRGSLFTMHGDAHIPSVVQHRGAGSAGELPESWLSIGLCGFTRKSSTPPTANIDIGWKYDGSEVLYCDKTVKYDSFCCRTEFYGSKALREVHFVFIGSIEGGKGEVVLTKKYVETRGMNEPHDIDADLTIESGIAAGI